MERPVLRLPPGFRFHPTDEELVVQYLRKKAASSPLPAAVVLDVDLGKYAPWELPGMDDGEGYFFTFRGEACRWRKGERYRRGGSLGYWEADSEEKPVVETRTGGLVGAKRAFIFHRRNLRTSSRARTLWIMHEYRLAATNSDWVACRIIKKHRPEKSRSVRRPPSPSSSSSSASSCVTEHSDEVEISS